MDLVIDRAPQLIAAKPAEGAIRLDALAEIGANKLCALLGRSEVRDLIDLKVLLESGQRLEDLLAGARAKEGGLEPATLAWVLSELHVGPDAPLPAGVSATDLDAFRRGLGKLGKNDVEALAWTGANWGRWLSLNLDSAAASCFFPSGVRR